jgi:hypothetical protein
MPLRTTPSALATHALLSLSLLALGCSEVVTPGAPDAAVDVPDAAVDVPGAAVDVPGACNYRHDVPTMAIRSVCDGMGRASCEQIGSFGGAGLTTHAICVGGANVCVFADRCTANEIASCRCGTEPPCHEGELCAAGAPGAVPHCTCLGPRAP